MSRNLPAVSLFLVIFFSTAAWPQQKLWDELQDKAISFYQKKQLDKAVSTAKEALAVCEKTFGPEHINMVESLDNLAIYEQAMGQFGEARKCYEMAVPILEKNVPPNDHYLAIFLDYVGSFYRRIGDEDEAKRLKERAREIRATEGKAGGK